jgi:predicted DNA-binding transcriptional regulator AlpA
MIKHAHRRAADQRCIGAKLLLRRHPKSGPSPDDVLPHGSALRPDASDDKASGGPLPRLLSTAEVAAVFNRSERTIRSWCRRGYFQPVRVGRAVFFQESDVRALITGRLDRDVLARLQGCASAVAVPAEISGVVQGKSLKIRSSRRQS